MTDEEVPAPAEPAAERRATPVWLKLVAAVAVLAIVVGIAGTVIRIPYDTLSPGSALDLAPLVTIHGAKTYSGRGDVMLLFVRERDHINLWSWLQAKLDSDIDLVKQTDISGGLPEAHLDLQGTCDMTYSKDSARVAALTALGYKLKPLPGVDVVDFPQGTVNKKTINFPAEKYLLPCDEISAVDGHRIAGPADVSKYIKAHKPGTSATLTVVRNGHTVTVKVPVVAYQGSRIIGIDAAPRFAIPFNIAIDTSGISGPSAGLAMTLAIIDGLTPGDLTGGKRVAVTGTISPNGDVGEIGGLPQKAVAAKAAHAQIFIVPVCVHDPGCDADLRTAKARVGKDVDVEPVATLAQALAILRKAGGAPLPAKTKT